MSALCVACYRLALCGRTWIMGSCGLLSRLCAPLDVWLPPLFRHWRSVVGLVHRVQLALSGGVVGDEAVAGTEARAHKHRVRHALGECSYHTCVGKPLLNC